VLDRRRLAFDAASVWRGMSCAIDRRSSPSATLQAPVEGGFHRSTGPVEAPAALMPSLPSGRARWSLSDLPLGVTAVEPQSTCSRPSVGELPAQTLPAVGRQRRRHAHRFGLDAPRSRPHGSLRGFVACPPAAASTR
jgi:hypothetical protein